MTMLSSKLAGLAKESHAQAEKSKKRKEFTRPGDEEKKREACTK
jgi:hypothetical protein